MEQLGSIAYIDGANLHKGIASLGWKLDYRKFRYWLHQKFGITQADIFIGMIADHAALYTNLQKSGFTLIFKEVVFDVDGKAKGNCDADLIVEASQDMYERGVRSVVLVSSDGDYAPLIKLWQKRGIRCTVLSPARMKKCSILIKRTGVSIVCLDDVREKLQSHLK